MFSEKNLEEILEIINILRSIGFVKSEFKIFRPTFIFEDKSLYIEYVLKKCQAQNDISITIIFKTLPGSDIVKGKIVMITNKLATQLRVLGILKLEDFIKLQDKESQKQLYFNLNLFV